MGHITSLCRELRNNPTEAESALWLHLRKRKRQDCKFLRQHPLIITNVQGKTEFIIADFYCAAGRLVIEVDGGYHQLLSQKDYDEQRDRVCKQLGLRVIRFTNEMVLNEVKEVLQKIDETLASKA